MFLLKLRKTYAQLSLMKLNPGNRDNWVKKCLLSSTLVPFGRKMINMTDGSENISEPLEREPELKPTMENLEPFPFSSIRWACPRCPTGAWPYLQLLKLPLKDLRLEEITLPHISNRQDFSVPNMTLTQKFESSTDNLFFFGVCYAYMFRHKLMGLLLSPQLLTSSKNTWK